MTPLDLIIPLGVIPDLARIPSIDSATIINRLDNEVALEITYTCRNYQGTEASKQQYEMTAIVDISRGMIKHRSLASSIETDLRKFKVHSPTGRYTVIGYKRQKNTSSLQLSFDVINAQLNRYHCYHIYLSF